MGFPFGSAGKESACIAGDLGYIPGLGRSPGEGKGYPLQYSGLENSMDCIVHGVAKVVHTERFHFHPHPHSVVHPGLSVTSLLCTEHSQYAYLSLKHSPSPSWGGSLLISNNPFRFCPLALQRGGR